MNKITINLPESFDTLMKESMDPTTNLEIDDVAREGYCVGILVSWCETMGRPDVADAMREANVE